MESQKKEVIVSVHMNHEVSPEIIEVVEQQEKTETVSCPNYDGFLHNVTLDTTVLDGLISKCCLTIEDREDIMNERRLSERNRMILNILMARPYGTFQTFKEELIEFDRSKIDLVSKMKNYDFEGDYNLAVFEVMDLSSHTIKLQKNFKILVNELATTNTIVDHLISDEVLCLEDQAEVCAPGNTKEQSNRLLLTKLMYKNADAYTYFLSALEEDTCYEELSKRIKNTEVTEEDKIKIHIGRITAKENKEKHTRDIHKREQTENIIPRNIQDQHNVLIEQWRNEDDSFVCTRAADEVLKHRLIQDWFKGLTASVFCNINMKNHEFIDKLMKALNNLDASEKKRLAQKTDNESRDSPLLLSSFIGNISLTKWLLENTGIPAKSKNLREVVSRVNRNNYIHPHINMQRENGTTSLYIACENGHLELLKMLLRYGADATLKKNTDDSPLSVACENGHTAIVNEILRNTDVDKDYQNKNGYSPLYFACQNGHAQIVQNLLIYKANINLCSKLDASPLFIACEKGYLSIVKNLLNYGANINRQNNTGQVPLHAACYKNHVEVVRMLLDKVNISVNILDNKNISPLYATCQCSKGHFEAMELLLQHNADVNIGRQPLIMTCANGNIKMSNHLIEHKADVNSCRSDGVSPLFMACQHRHYETVCLLFKFNADPNVHRENCASPLMIASQNGDVEIVEKLLKHGCNINRCTSDGVSSLYLAAQNGHSNVVSQLIEAGASLDMSDTDGKTALFKACQNGHLEIVLKLLTCKANAHLRMVNNVSPMEIAEKNKHLEIMKVLKKLEIDETKLSSEKN
ncbi:unnamed protein product [Mytilus edulis]|uniref:CARD domain-containing protein n=1 Tax=Mytilus edulis TaxID=6550 RepID=A0A8S3PQG5_MYTED|nr:unnamed protein product [Mytilus edulis]